MQLHLDRDRFALARCHCRKQRVDGVSLLGHHVGAERATDELRGADAEHLLQRGVDLHRPALVVQAKDPDRGALEQRPESSQRSRLSRARLDLRRSRDRRRQHHRQHLERVAVLLVQTALGAAHHVQRADHLAAAQQWHADQALVPALRAKLLVDPGVVGCVLDEDRLPALDRKARDRARDRTASVERLDRDARHRAGVQHRPLDQVDHRAVRAGDRLRALGDQLDDALQLFAGGRDVAPGLDDQ